MIFSGNRSELRRVFVDAWRKHRSGAPLEPMERQITSVVVRHPEYHGLLESEDAVEFEFGIEDGLSNPFLHLSLHIAIQEQLSIDRPAGIRQIYQSLLESYPDPHELEHALMDCLAPCLWEAQRRGAPPDEAEYLDCARLLGRRPRVR